MDVGAAAGCVVQFEGPGHPKMAKMAKVSSLRQQQAVSNPNQETQRDPERQPIQVGTDHSLILEYNTINSNTTTRSKSYTRKILYGKYGPYVQKLLFGPTGLNFEFCSVHFLLDSLADS